MNVQVETIIATYDEELQKLQKENIALKVQLKQLEKDKEKYSEAKPVQE